MHSTRICRFAFLAPLLSACSGFPGDGVPGNGVTRSEVREVGELREIEVHGTMVLEATAAGAPRVSISGDANLLPLVETRVEAGRLVVTSKRSLRPKLPLVVTVSAPGLRRVSVHGAARAEVKGIEGDEFRLAVSGAGSAKLAGRAQSAAIEVSGAGDIDARELYAARADVSVSGAGNVAVHATEALRARVSGVGNITYSGDPKRVDREVSGVGNIAAE